tara:strand:+ start:545 stop:814 length:270 start_codon:yes stop_codon:yes gene_type:complete
MINSGIEWSWMDSLIINSDMKAEHKQANEHFFERVITMLHEGGKYSMIEKNRIFTKVGKKLVAEKKEAYDEVKMIVTKEYLDRRFDYRK